MTSNLSHQHFCLFLRYVQYFLLKIYIGICGTFITDKMETNCGTSLKEKAKLEFVFIFLQECGHLQILVQLEREESRKIALNRIIDSTITFISSRDFRDLLDHPILRWSYNNHRIQDSTMRGQLYESV